MEMPDIPDFLKVANRGPAPAIEPRRIRRKREPKRDWRLPRSLEPASLELLRQIEAERKAKIKARLAALKEKKSAARKRGT